MLSAWVTDSPLADIDAILNERVSQAPPQAWALRFGAILMPLPMMTITQVAAKFNAPFGVAWQRCKDLRPDLLKVAPPESGTP